MMRSYAVQYTYLYGIWVNAQLRRCLRFGVIGGGRGNAEDLSEVDMSLGDSGTATLGAGAVSVGGSGT